MKGPAQLGLFGGESPIDPREEPIPPPDPALVQLASRVPSHVHLGTSSWTFPGWKGLVYRRRYTSERALVDRSLEEYARHPLLRTVGIDRSYYAPVPQAELARWSAQLPDGYRCVMKVWDGITAMVFPEHARMGSRAGQPNPSFLDPERFELEVASPVREAFADHLAAFVLEIPPSPVAPDPRAFVDRLERFLARAPQPFHYAVELRDRRLLTPRYLRVLREHGATHVFNLWSRMPPLGAQLDIEGALMGPVCVARLMLPVGTKYEARREAFAPFDRIVEEQPQTRADVVRLARMTEELGVPLFVIVNNKVEGCSPLTIRALCELLAAR
jgi:uncharacterized protein YecE (DUF72 family)